MHLTQTLHRAVQQDGNGVATVFGNRTRTWAESADRIARIAGGLRSLGVVPGDRVGMLGLNSDRYHEYLFATPWADAVVNPVNIRWSPQEIAYSFEDSGTSVLLVDDNFLGVVPELRALSPTLKTVIYCGDGDAPQGTLSFEELAHSDPVPDARRGGDALAGIFYTGGTTAFPKGVMLSHTSLMVAGLGSSAAHGGLLVPGGRLLHAAPMFHLADLAAWTIRNLLGGTHVIIPAFTPAAATEAIEKHRCTDALLVPTILQMMVDSPAIHGADLTSLSKVLYGASPISEGLLERLRAALPDVAWTQAYGMTELSPIATLLGPEDHDNPRLRTSAGRSAPHSEVRIAGPDGQALPRGEVGEVLVRGDHVMLGYWGKPAETEQALQDGWMHTGDGGRMDERGYVFIVDRIKDMILTGGENVYSAEVENAISKHPAVAAVAVIGVHDPKWGERVHAVVVAKPDTQLSLQELREHTKKHIAGYKAPRSLEVVDALPTSAAGKILKRELRARHQEGSDRAVH